MTTYIIKDWRDERKIKSWVTISLDFNHIEHLWGTLTKKLENLLLKAKKNMHKKLFKI